MKLLTYVKQWAGIACYDAQKLVGFLSVVGNSATDTYIQDIMVAPDYQGQGIGSMCQVF